MTTGTIEKTSTSPDLETVIAALNDVGYAIIPSVISPQKADEVRTILEGFLDAERTEKHLTAKTQRVARIAVKHPIFVDLMCNPTILEIWRRWLGKNMICSTWTANTIYPGHTHIGWHADYPYGGIDLPWPSDPFTGQTIWMLDDFTEENGATGIVPGSQRCLHPPDHANAWRDDGVVLTGVRGSVAVLHGAMWHTGRPNVSNSPRSCLLGMYIRPHCVPMENMRGQLSEIDNPSETTKQIMGFHQYQSTDVKA